MMQAPRQPDNEVACLADCVEAEVNQIILKKQSQLLSQTQQLSKIITPTQSQFIQEEGQRNKCSGQVKRSWSLRDD